MMRDGGPIYRETDMTALVKEPLNMATAALFALMACYWLYRLHSRRDELRFLYWVNWGLLVGGVGGTIFHGFRAHFIFLAMDFIPILVLAVAAAPRYWFRVLPRKVWVLVPLVLLTATRPLLFVSPWPRHIVIGVSYASLGLFIVIPLLVYLIRSGGENTALVIISIAAFSLALFFRTYDMAPQLSRVSGGHWLCVGCVWVSVLCLEIYIYRDSIPRASNDIEIKR